MTYTLIPLYAAFVLSTCIVDDTDSSILQRARDGWKSYSAFANTLCGTTDITVIMNGTKKGDYHINNKHNGTSKLSIQIDKTKKTDSHAAYCTNDKYGFTVRKENGAGWRMINVEKQPLAVASRELRETADSRRLSHALLYVYNCYIEDLVGGSNFKVEKFERSSDNLIRIYFTNVAPTGESPSIPIQSGTLILDSDKFWVVKSCSLSIVTPDGSTGKVVIENTYTISDGFPIPVDNKEKYVFDLKRPTPRTHNQSIDRAFGLSPSNGIAYSEFTLRAFGLPEPEWLVDPSTRFSFPLFVYLTLGGILLLILAAFFQYRRNRSAA